MKLTTNPYNCQVIFTKNWDYLLTSEKVFGNVHLKLGNPLHTFIRNLVMDIHNTIITRENVVEFLSIPGANGEHAVSVVRGLLEEVNRQKVDLGGKKGKK